MKKLRIRALSLALATMAISASACSGGTGSGGAGGGGGGPETVTGVVVDQLNGAPVANAAVYVVGMKNAFTTDPSGHFTIPNVTPPYDITVSSTGATNLNIYAGVTRANVRLTLPNVLPASAVQAPLNVMLTNLFPGETDIASVRIAIATAVGGGTGVAFIGEAGGGTLSGNLYHVPLVDFYTSVPLSFYATAQACAGASCSFRYGTGTATAPATATSLDASLSLSDVPTDTYVLGSLPASYAPAGTWYAGLVGPDGAVYDDRSATSFGGGWRAPYGSSIQMPRLPGWLTVAWLEADTSTPTGANTFIKSGAVPGTPITPTPIFAGGPTIVSPTGGAVAWPTNIRWNPTPGSSGGLYALSTRLSTKVVTVYTASTSYFVPDLSVIGVLYSAGEQITLQAAQASDMTSSDALVDPGSPLYAGLADAPIIGFSKLDGFTGAIEAHGNTVQCTVAQ